MGDKETLYKQGQKFMFRWPIAWPQQRLFYRIWAYDRIRDNFPKYVVTLDEFDMSRNGKHRKSETSCCKRSGIDKTILPLVGMMIF